MNLTVLKAIFKRDFVSYFSNPTGYVFICVFVMLSSLAAFWPPEFFGNNLANLDQLSQWMPFILVVFIPAITMSIWAEERRQGTDELLLTLPASDTDVVLGKFKAGVAIFTVALLFSMFSIFLVFAYGLGSPDPGLFLCTYLGYWFVGLAMLSIGMVASFLTSNLTVGFILGVLFNAPLALSGVADWVVKDARAAEAIRSWSALARFEDFARGVVSLGGVVYFLSIVAVMLYVSMVLIGRRHWSGGEDGQSLGWHFLARAVALLVVAAGVNSALASRNTVRADLTSEKLNSLAGRTVELLQELGADEDVGPIKVDVYVSPQVPAEYASQKRELLATLDEMRSISGGKVQVAKHEVENFSEEATLAERAYGIEARRVESKVRGARQPDEIFLGAAFTCGLDKVVLPFLDKGLPVEYELVRSITTVAQQQRKKVGVLKTDVQLNAGFTMQGPTPESQLIGELKKQYEVKEVDPQSPITDKYDVLLAVQPSSLSPEAMDNFVAAIKAGQPVLIFEDPFPIPQFYPGVPGTSEPKQPGGGMMGMFGGGGPPQPKGEIAQLWDLLGVALAGDQTVWQRYNPYPSAGTFVTEDWVFVDPDNGAVEAFSSEDPITSGLSQVLTLYPGALRKQPGAKVEFRPLMVTGKESGSVRVAEVQAAAQMGGQLRRMLTSESYVLAAHVTGRVQREVESDLEESADDKELAQADAALEEAANEPTTKKKDEPLPEINAVVVADIDCLADPFFAIRAMGDDEDALVGWRFQNVVFALNALDALAGDDRYLEVRKRSRDYRTLTRVEEATKEFREELVKIADEAQAKADEQKAQVEKEFRDKITEIENRTDLAPNAKRQLIDRERIRLGRVRDVKVAKIEKERDRTIKQSDRELGANIRGVQDYFKLLAVVLPPVLPVLLASLVFFRRRQMEQEGVAKTRLRFGSAAPPDTPGDAAGAA